MNSRLIITLIILIALGAGIYLWMDKDRNTSEEAFCTQDVKLCPDGSYVGRQAPSCEFQACPEVEVEDSHADLIRVTSPTVNAVVSSPLKITGEARGNWYFEASFPVKLLDANGKQLAIAPAQAQGEWMTTEFVPFEVTLTFATPTTSTGTLVLEKDNPSGEARFDDSISIPVRFSQ